MRNKNISRIAGAVLFFLAGAAASPLRALETKIRGGQMELENKGETVRFRGGVQMDRGADRINAAEMTTNRGRDKVTATGDVRLLRVLSATETWKGFGNTGFYDTTSGAGYLVGDAHQLARLLQTAVVSSTITRSAEIFADRFDFTAAGAGAEKSAGTPNRGRDKVTATGDVRMTREVSATETWKGFGDVGFFDSASGAGYLSSDPARQARLVQATVLSSTMTRSAEIVAGRFNFTNEGKRAVAIGAVHGKTFDPETSDVYEFWSQQAEYDGVEKKITLTGAERSIMKQLTGKDGRVVRGDVITYYLDSKKLISDGNAEAVFNDLAGEAKKK